MCGLRSFHFAFGCLLIKIVFLKAEIYGLFEIFVINICAMKPQKGLTNYTQSLL